MTHAAEQCVIGALLMELDAIHKIYDILQPEMFSNDLFGRMYVEILKAYDNNQKIDVVLLSRKMQDANIPLDVVGKEIKECLEQTLTSANIKFYAQAVVDDYKARMLSMAINNIEPLACNIDSQIGKLINELESLQSGEKLTARTMNQVVQENRDKYFCDNYAEKLFTGFPKLDNLLGGLEGGDIIVIGARPGVGKSALVTQIAKNMANQSKKIGYYNLEMKEKQVYERFIVNHSGIGLTRLRRAKKFLGDEQKKFDEANEFLSSQNITISTGCKSPSKIRNECKHMDYDIIIIDYLQLLKSDIRYQNRTSEVGAISKAIKEMAMELNVPVILLSQLNRVSEAKETKEPTMAELREAGDIEQDASIVILIWNLTKDRTAKGLKTDKNRQGAFGEHVMRFNGDLMQFEEVDETIKQAKEWEKADSRTPFNIKTPFD